MLLASNLFLQLLSRPTASLRTRSHSQSSSPTRPLHHPTTTIGSPSGARRRREALKRMRHPHEAARAHSARPAPPPAPPPPGPQPLHLAPTAFRLLSSGSCRARTGPRDNSAPPLRLRSSRSTVLYCTVPYRTVPYRTVPCDDPGRRTARRRRHADHPEDAAAADVPHRHRPRGDGTGAGGMWTHLLFPSCGPLPVPVGRAQCPNRGSGGVRREQGGPGLRGKGL